MNIDGEEMSGGGVRAPADDGGELENSVREMREDAEKPSCCTIGFGTHEARV